MRPCLPAGTSPLPPAPTFTPLASASPASGPLPAIAQGTRACGTALSTGKPTARSPVWGPGPGCLSAGSGGFLTGPRALACIPGSLNPGFPLQFVGPRALVQVRPRQVRLESSHSCPRSLALAPTEIPGGVLRLRGCPLPASAPRSLSPSGISRPEPGGDSLAGSEVTPS